jgi:hypothetical protein
MSISRPCVVMYGTDEMLLHTRQWILESRGLQTIGLTHLHELQRISVETPIDLVILCHSLDQEGCDAALAVAAIRWPDTKTLILAPHLMGPSRLVGERKSVISIDGPRKLISSVEALLHLPSMLLHA